MTRRVLASSLKRGKLTADKLQQNIALLKPTLSYDDIVRVAELKKLLASKKTLAAKQAMDKFGLKGTLKVFGGFVVMLGIIGGSAWLI